MKLAQRTLMGFGGLALAAGLLSLALPQKAHGLVAALVQVINTAAAPAVTEDVSKLASQNISLWATTQAGFLTSQLLQRFKDGTYTSSYTVPPGQTLMITSVDFIPNSGSSFTPLMILNDSANSVTEFGRWWAPPGVTSTLGTNGHYSYPSGIAIQSGITPQISASPGYNGNMYVQIHGYLTTN